MKKQLFIPILSTLAGGSLTHDNWQQIGVSSAVWHIDDLLMKPGLSYLNRLPSLADYLRWPGAIILNASHLSADSHGVYRLKNRFDGSLITLSTDTLCQLIGSLQPTAVLMPPALRPQGAFYTTVPAVHGEQDYLIGEFSFEQVQQLLPSTTMAIISNQPAEMSRQGWFYQDNTPHSILENDYRLDFQRLDSQCSCPTCQQGFTRAYLHHLYQQTPLLAQRYLIQHTVSQLLSTG